MPLTTAPKILSRSQKITQNARRKFSIFLERALGTLPPHWPVGRVRNPPPPVKGVPSPSPLFDTLLVEPWPHLLHRVVAAHHVFDELHCGSFCVKAAHLRLNPASHAETKPNQKLFSINLMNFAVSSYNIFFPKYYTSVQQCNQQRQI